MKFQFINIGKPHDEVLKKAIDDYTKRVNNYYNVEWLIIPPAKNAAALPEAALKRQEGKLILSKIKNDDFVMLLDETGRQLTSVELSNFIEQKVNAGVRTMVFLIGGAFGVSDEIKQRANFIWSLSRLVFPHILVRLILAEQVYRACTILRNEKYHHV
ncbi:23S rRNA (pseudouridine(1915)-N(3))-methyltransferase RlmH [Parafilimonas sp.]|uniref:23S rRNA (pseudouridine(1915)-N(3))-methyltransferase RlmH n=1 Tax=Parafilimonas sp. TaxID=1969739 RepID=UPI0039E5BDE9